jgi:hydroxymethylbilane synthase
LLDGQIDLSVHSLKDLPTAPALGLTIAAVPERESPRDVLVSSTVNRLEALPRSARVGTGSLRRKAQLLYLRPDLVVEDIRGNVETRLRKLDDGQFDAIILAEAGLKRLGFADRIRQVLPPEIMLPAVGQGALGIEARSDDALTRSLLASLDDGPTHRAVTAERTLLSTLLAGCLAPVGAWARVVSGRLLLDAVVLSPDGRQRLVASAAGEPSDAAALGQQAAEDLLRQGAAQLIAAARG